VSSDSPVVVMTSASASVGAGAWCQFLAQQALSGAPLPPRQDLLRLQDIRMAIERIEVYATKNLGTQRYGTRFFGTWR
jgi:hypothetical protein